jgi:hypothetical protein
MNMMMRLARISYGWFIAITSKAALKFGSEAWVLKKREEQRLEAAQMKVLRHLLGIITLDKEKDQCIRGENWGTEHSTGNKTVPEKVATICTEGGQKENTKTGNKIQNGRKKERGTTEEEMEGPTSF